MDAKKFLAYLIIVIVLCPMGAPLAFGGPTSISGTMSCTMPTLLEMNEPAAAPKAQEGMALQQTTFRGPTRVVTVCAK